MRFGAVPVGAAAKCRPCAVWSLGAPAARVQLQGAALELGCWCRCRCCCSVRGLVLLSVVYAGLILSLSQCFG